ncbi:MAG TPA: NAD(P)-dependent oxidoreductase [Nitrospiraceae bacterium]|nr:NAD(P)-dependent oxidoreductase [Nitrospiraceae bacterium]
MREVFPMAARCPRPRILNAEPEGYSGKAHALLAELGDVMEGPLSRDALCEALADIDILIVRLAHQIDRELLAAGRQLKIIVSATTGLDHIDLAAAADRHIAVLSLRGEADFLRNITATAELTWALLLALMRRVPEALASVRDGEWNRDAFRGRDLSGRRLGIIGLGRVGRQVAEFASAFRMTVAAYDPHVTSWPAAVHRKASMAALLRETDVLSVHVNLHPGTIGLIGRQELALLPRGSVLINTSRGDVVDADALVEALDSGHLSGAALDVVPFERDHERRRASPLFAYAAARSNLLITPHIAGATVEAMHKTEEFMAHKLLDFYRLAAAASPLSAS